MRQAERRNPSLRLRSLGAMRIPITGALAIAVAWTLLGFRVAAEGSTLFPTGPRGLC
jgi:hypothetical protein